MFHEPIDRIDSGPYSGLKAELTFPPPGVPNHELNQRNSGSLPAPGERESEEFTLGDALEHDPGKKNCVLPELLAHYEASRPASSTANSQYQHLLHNIFSKKLGLLRTQQQFAKLRSSSDKRALSKQEARTKQLVQLANSAQLKQPIEAYIKNLRNPFAKRKIIR